MPPKNKSKDEPEFSAADRAIIESFKITMDGLGAYLGEAFELVLHDLRDWEHSIIKIINGFHSGRREGGPITDLALSMLEEIRKKAGGTERPALYTTYVSPSKYGKPVRSTTIVIPGERKTAIGLLCINLYLDSPISALIQSFSLVPPQDYITEHFSADSGELVKRTLERVRAEVQNDHTISPSQKNKEIITLLYHQGIFKLKNAVQTISEDLGISKNTVYLHIRALEKGH